MNHLNQYCAAYLRGFVNISANISQGFVPWKHVEPARMFGLKVDSIYKSNDPAGTGREMGALWEMCFGKSHTFLWKIGISIIRRFSITWNGCGQPNHIFLRVCYYFPPVPTKQGHTGHMWVRGGGAWVPKLAAILGLEPSQQPTSQVRLCCRDSPTEPRILKLKRDAPGITFYFFNVNSWSEKKSILSRTDSCIRKWGISLNFNHLCKLMIFVKRVPDPDGSGHNCNNLNRWKNSRTFYTHSF